MRFPSQPIAGCSGGACHPSDSGGTNKRIMGNASLGIKQDPISKIMPNTKRAGGEV
jgi:hypothetical protein